MSPRKSRKRASVDDLAQAWGITPAGATKFLQRPDAPPRGADGAWSLVDALEFRKTRLEQKRGGKPPAPGTVAAARFQKITLECHRLQLAIDKEKGELVSIAEVTSTLAEYALHVNQVFDSWTMRCSALTKDPVLVDAAEKLSDEMRQTLADAILASST